MTMTMTMTMTTAPSISSEELVDALNKGIISAIQTCGKSLPSSAIPIAKSSPFQCEWSEYCSTTTTHCSPVVEDLRQYFPPLKGNQVGSDGRPLLYAACLGLLLSDRAKMDGIHTPLSTYLSIALFLLDELHVNPNQPTLTQGACLRPPLHLLARSCHPSAVHALITKRANPYLKDKEGWTALMACCMPDIVLKGDNASNDRLETLQLLLKGCDDENNDGATNVNDTNYCGYTALHYACEGLNYQLIQCLLEDGGADATLRTVWGQSCIGIIRSQSHKSQEDALKCETMVMSHLEKTGRMESIRSFLEEEKKAMVVMDLVDEVLIPASRRPESDSSSGNVDAQDRRIVVALIQYLGVDPDVLCHSKLFEQWPHDHANLYEHIHQRVMDLLPLAWLRVYRSSPTTDERDIIACTNYDLRANATSSTDGVRHIDPSKIMSQSFRLFRERGHYAKQLELLHDLIAIPLQRTFGFGIPSNAILNKIMEYAPRIVEMGAGTGYWSYCLSRMGADIVAYDPYPTGHKASNHQNGKDSNEFLSSQSYFPVQVGDASTVFDGSNSDMLDRALLIVWPNNPDSEDNKHFAKEGTKLPTIWDWDCLERYHELGGDTVIYVGEREAKIELLPEAGADCGFCSSRKFQLYLQENYKLEAELECPRWWMKEDDVTVWKRL